MRRSHLLALITVWFGLACGEQGRRSGTDFSVLDSAGIQLVTSAGPSVGELGVTEELRLGSVEGEGPTLFSQIRRVVIGPNGRIFVANAGSTSVRVFDSEGRFLTEFGRSGDGPSELSTINDLILVGDSVLVVDWQRGGKAVLFSSDGAFVDSWSLMRPDGSRVIPTSHVEGTGWFVNVHEPFQRPDLSPGERLDRTIPVHLVESGLDSIGRRVHDRPEAPVYGVEGGEGGIDWSLFRPTTALGFDSQGQLYQSGPEAYRVDIYAMGGNLKRSVRRPYEPRRIVEDDVERLRELTLAVADTTSRIPDQFRSRQKEALAMRFDRQSRLPRPEVASPIQRLLVSPDGGFWAERTDTADLVRQAVSQTWGREPFPSSSTTWDVFDPEGRWVGHVELPARFRAEDLRGDTVVGVWANELDVEHVVLLTLETNAE